MIRNLIHLRVAQYVSAIISLSPSPEPPAALPPLASAHRLNTNPLVNGVQPKMNRRSKTYLVTNGRQIWSSHSTNHSSRSLPPSTRHPGSRLGVASADVSASALPEKT